MRDNGHKKKQEVYTSYMETHFDYEDSQAVDEVSQGRCAIHAWRFSRLDYYIKSWATHFDLAADPALRMRLDRFSNLNNSVILK